MTEAQLACLKKLKDQTLGKSGTVNMCGRQIWDLVRADNEFAEIVSVDLDNKDMTVSCCEAKIRAAADAKHREQKGSSACISPDEAENIIRKFYGLPERTVRDPWEEETEKTEEPVRAEEKQKDPDIFNLEDFL